MYRLVNGQFERQDIDWYRVSAYGALFLFDCAVWMGLYWVVLR